MSIGSGDWELASLVNEFTVGEEEFEHGMCLESYEEEEEEGMATPVVKLDDGETYFGRADVAHVVTVSAADVDKVK
jgi:hypothetical protein